MVLIVRFGMAFYVRDHWIDDALDGFIARTKDLPKPTPGFTLRATLAAALAAATHILPARNPGLIRDAPMLPHMPALSLIASPRGSLLRRKFVLGNGNWIFL